jgi:hypothetical protein
MWSRETPTGIYNESSKMCLDNFEVRDALGTPIKVTTTESGGLRVFHIRHKYFFDNGHLYLMMNYYLEGPRNRGTVHCKVKKDEKSGRFEYEYVIVKLNYSYRGQNKIIIKNNEQN